MAEMLKKNLPLDLKTGLFTEHRELISSRVTGLPGMAGIGVALFAAPHA